MLPRLLGLLLALALPLAGLWWAVRALLGVITYLTNHAG
jgi:hypothetical protein